MSSRTPAPAFAPALAVLALFCAFAGARCHGGTGPREYRAPGGDPAGDPGGHPEGTSDAPRWIALFDGESLAGWTPKIRGYPAGENFARTFRVEDGAIQVAYDGYEGRFDDRFGHLFHDLPWSRYRLRVEYRFTGEQVPGGPGWAWRNSGVMVHGQTPESMALDQSFPASIEIQLLGGDGQAERHNANLCTPGTHVVIDGELVKRHCTDSTSRTYHGDGWVTLEVLVDGHDRIVHSLEGEPVLTYAAPQLDPNDADARRLIDAGANALLTSGTISLQSESHPVEFRRVEIMPLDR